MKGKAKEAVGDLTGNKDLKSKGEKSSRPVDEKTVGLRGDLVLIGF
jgi:hypothetical protein